LSLVARIAESHGAVIHTGEGLDDVGFGIAVAFPALREGAPMAAKGTKTRAPAARERTSST
jgi:hypothetical protein